MLPKLFFISILCSFILTHSYSQCLDHQKTLLLHLKNEFKFNSSTSSYLLHWNQTNDCCGWGGVECDVAGNVVSLELDGEDLSRGVANSWTILTNFSSLTTLSLVSCRLKGYFPSEIFRLPTLQSIDLSFNELLKGSLPPFTQSGSLKVIRLKETNFSGSIPDSIGNLKTLWYIDLSYCQFTGSIPSTFANLTELTHVYLNGNFFTGSLSSSTKFVGHSNLVDLHLGDNSFSGKIPHYLFNLPSLLELGLSNNKLMGAIEDLPSVNVSNLVGLYLSGNGFEGPIPDFFFSRLHSLESLSLSGNMFNGSFQLSKIQRLVNLTVLDLSDNNLSMIDSSVDDNSSTAYGVPQLKYVFLASCNLYHFPHFLKHCESMLELDLSNNRIGGVIPSWIWGSQLLHLNLSLNLLTGMQMPYQVPLRLYVLDLHSNRFVGELELQFPSASQTSFVSLANNSLHGPIPTSLCRVTRLSILNLSANRLSGTIPSCLLDKLFSVLDLGQNNISGRIPDNFSLGCKLEYLDFSSNNLEGKIPKSLESCTSLELMNVGNNLISDAFPCMLPPSLRVLVLHSNRFHGQLTCRKRWPDLQILDISWNNFSGSLESLNFSTWRRMVVNNESRYIHSGYDYMHKSYDYAYGVRITMKGHELELVKIWPDFTSVDLSCNNFHGEIPNAIGDLSSLRLLNLSHNALKGNIPESVGKMRDLESLDLSANHLVGAIPMELGGLTFLSFLNLSYNELVGRIPNGHQLQTFLADSFYGNPRLCGFNLNISCSNQPDDDGRDGNVEEKKKREIEWEYVSTALGYVVGLGSFVWLLIFSRRLRYKYFDKVDEVVEEILDILDGTRRRRRKRARRAAVLRNRGRRQ